MVDRRSARSLFVTRGAARGSPWLASLLVALQLAGLAHMLLVPHAVSRDGALVHPGGAAHATTDPARERSARPSLASNRPREDEGGRDVCAVASAQTRNPGAHALWAHCFEETPRAVLLSRGSETRPDARAAVYRLAPKQSPPT